MLIGDSNDFQEYAKSYYNIYSSLKSDDLLKISQENQTAFDLAENELSEQMSRIKPFVITISNATNPIAYHIIPKLVELFTRTNTDIKVNLFERNLVLTEKLYGIRMEIEDLAADSLRSIRICENENEAFNDCDLIILLDEFEELDMEADSHAQSKKYIIGKFYNPYVDLGNCVHVQILIFFFKENFSV
jgi:hypothetical protein